MSRLPDEDLGGNVQAADELPDHSQRESVFSVQDLRDTAPAHAEDVRQLLPRLPGLLQPEEDGLYRIRGRDRFVLLFVAVYERGPGACVGIFRSRLRRR